MADKTPLVANGKRVEVEPGSSLMMVIVTIISSSTSS
jgi:hypothetical protein